MNILFAYLPTENDKYLALSQNRFSKFIGAPELIYPMTPASGLTLLKKAGYNVSFIDSIYERLSVDKFLEKLKEIEPDLLVFETKTPIIKKNWKTVNLIKEKFPDIKIAVVGDHVSVLPEETLKNSKTDYVLTGGDFDVSMLNLAGFLSDKHKLPKGIYYRENKKIKNTGYYELVEDLDKLPFIDRTIIPWQNYHESWRKSNKFFYMMGSRGCPYRCSFCSWPQMLYQRKVRIRSANNVLDELEMLVKKFGAEEIFFDDDTFTFNKKWVLDFCNGIKKRNLKIKWACNGRVDNTDEEMLKAMKESGCRLIKYGVESASPFTLKKIRKGYTKKKVVESFRLSRKYGILRHATAMIGYPWETKKDIIETIKFIKSLKTDTVQFSIPIVYPGTDLFKEAKEKKWLRFKEGEWEKFDMSKPTLKNKELSGEEIVNLCRLAWKQVYFSPVFMLDKLLRIRNLGDITWLLKGFKAVLKGHLSSIKNK